MDHDETGCRAPEGPILCANNCGFFGSATTMNLCSKCHKDMILKQAQANVAASSIGGIMKGSRSTLGSEKESVIVVESTADSVCVDEKVGVQQLEDGASSKGRDNKQSERPNRCNSCNKKVGLTGFKCRCGELFCAVHRHFEKHGCMFDYKAHARDAITTANPVVKAEKLDKI